MTFILFLQIAFVCLLGAMSPGPSMMVVINNAIFKNKFNGILTAFGHGFGIGIYALFAVIGIGIVIETNIIVFNTLKTLSVIFSSEDKSHFKLVSCSGSRICLLNTSTM